MSVQTDRGVSQAVVGDMNENTFVGQVWHRYQAFQAPFSERRLILRLGDVLLLALATMTPMLLQAWVPQFDLNIPQISNSWYWIIFWLVIWMVIANLNDLYDIPTSYNRTLTVFRILVTGWLSLMIFVPVSFLFLQPILSQFALVSLVFALPLIIVWRMLYIKVSSLNTFNHRVIVVGSGDRAKTIVNLLEDKAELNIEVLGCVDDRSTVPEASMNDLIPLGHTTDLPGLVHKNRIHEIVIATEKGIDQDLFRHLTACQANGVRLTFMPDFYARIQRRVPVEYIDAYWATHALLDQPLFKRLQLGIKRLVDIALLLCALPILVLLLPWLALAIRLDSPGSVFYRQVRSGRAGKPFQIIKFRTMVSDAEADGKPQWAGENDSRITRVGSFLRKSRLDELPQLMNVLKGDMSFVGPRPERPEFVEQLNQQIPYFDTRLMVKPGLTGWAQVHYHYGNSTEDAQIKLQYDFYYIHHWSFWVDLYILFRTVAVVVTLGGH